MLKERGVVENLAIYVENNLKKGYAPESLKWALINQGYSKLEVEKAIKKAQSNTLSGTQLKTPKMEPKAIISPVLQEEEKKGFFSKLFGL